MNRVRLTDEQIRLALSPSEDMTIADLRTAIRREVEVAPQHRNWWTAHRPALVPARQVPPLRVVLLLIGLFVVLLALAILAGSRRSTTLGDGSMFHGGIARTGEMAGPGPVGGARIAWTATLHGPLTNGMPALADGRLYVADGRGTVSVYDSLTGQEGWSRALRRPASSPAFANGLLVVGAGDGVYALDAASGTIRWHFPTDDPVESSPAVDQGVAYVGLPDGSVVAIDLASGEQRWRTTVGGPVRRALAVADGVVLGGGDGGSFAALRESDGTVAWTAVLGPGGVSTPAVRDGVVLVASGLDDPALPHRFAAFRAKDGTALWDYSPPSGNALYVAAAGPDLVYAVGLDGNVTALHDGGVRWQVGTGAAIGSVATLATDTLYVSVSDGTVRSFDAGSGAPGWTVDVSGDPGPAIVDGDRLYVGTALGQLVAMVPSSDAAVSMADGSR